MSDRFAQLTYTSYAAPSETGQGRNIGWQIKEATRNLSQAQRVALIGWVSRHIEPVEPLPQFPTPENIAGLPRRLLYFTPNNERGVIFVHSVPAGVDSAGRQGNVFTHVLWDFEGSGERPIDWWGSPDWLCPYGPERVAAAALPSIAPRPGRAACGDAVLDFLFDGTWREDMLRVLLDATADTYRRGIPIVLATESPQVAALWIGAVSYFMSAGTARKLSWCTFDRADAVSATLALGIGIVAIPVADISALDAGKVDSATKYALIDTTGTIDPGDLDDPYDPHHHTQHGARVPVTEWSVLARSVLEDRDTAAQALTQLDRIADAAGDTGLSPMWPLAKVINENPGTSEHIRAVAGRVVARDAPRRAIPDRHRQYGVQSSTPDLPLPRGASALPWTFEPKPPVPVDVPQAPTVPEPEPGAVVEPPHPQFAGSNFPTDHVSRVRPPRIDYEWFVNVRKRFSAGEGMQERPRLEAAAEVAGFLATGECAQFTSPGIVALETLRLVELFGHRGLIGPAAISESLRAAVLKHVVPLLQSVRAPQPLPPEADDIKRWVRTQFTLPLVVSSPEFYGRPLGHRLHPAAAMWLLGPEPAGPTFDDLRKDQALAATSEIAVLADYLFSMALHGTPAELAKLVTGLPIALARALHESTTEGWPRSEIDPLFARGVRWPVEQLLVVDFYYPGGISPELCKPSIVGSPASDVPALWLSDRISHRAGSGVEDAPVAWARLFSIRSWTDVGIRSETLLAVLADFGRLSRPDIATSMVPKLAIAYIIGRSSDRTAGAALKDMSPHSLELLVQAISADPGEAIRLLHEIIVSNLCTANWICFAAIATSAANAGVAGAMSAEDPLARMRIERGGPTIFEAVAAEYLRDPEGESLDTRWLFGVFETELNRTSTSVPWLEQRYGQFIEQWLADTRSPTGLLSKLRRIPKIGKGRKEPSWQPK